MAVKIRHTTANVSPLIARLKNTTTSGVEYVTVRLMVVPSGGIPSTMKLDESYMQVSNNYFLWN